jgi:hypothetical protein
MLFGSIGHKNMAKKADTAAAPCQSRALFSKNRDDERKECFFCALCAKILQYRKNASMIRRNNINLK